MPPVVDVVAAEIAVHSGSKLTENGFPPGAQVDSLPQDVHPAICVRLGNWPRVVGFVFCHICVCRDFQIGVGAVGHVGVAVGTVELGPGSVTVSVFRGAGHNVVHLAGVAAVQGGDHTSVVRPALCSRPGLETTVPNSVRDDVDDPAHRVAAVQNGGRTSHHFDAVDAFQIVGIGQRMAHHPHEIGPTVDEHQNLRVRCSPDTAQRDSSRCAGSNTKAHHAPLSYVNTWRGVV